MRYGHRELVSSPAYFLHVEGKNSLVNSLFHFCSMWFKNWWRHVFKNVLCDIRQVVTQRNSSKETARSRDHPSRSFRTPRNEDSQNLKPLSTSESAKTLWSSGTSPCQLASSEARTVCSWKPWHSFNGPFSGSVWLSLLYSASTA